MEDTLKPLEELILELNNKKEELKKEENEVYKKIKKEVIDYLSNFMPKGIEIDEYILDNNKIHISCKGENEIWYKPDDVKRYKILESEPNVKLAIEELKAKGINIQFSVFGKI